MRRAAYDLLMLASLIVVGAGLTLFSAASPRVFRDMVALATTLAFLLAMLVVIRGLRSHARPVIGFSPLLIGLLLLATSSALSLFPPSAAAAGRVLTFGLLSSQDVIRVVQAMGALGLALGFSFWARGLVDGFVRSSMRERTLEREVEHLGQNLKQRASELREMDVTDDQTGVLNRRAFIAAFRETVDRDARLHEPAAFLLLRAADGKASADQDRSGDGRATFVEIAQALRSGTRGTDLIGRLGRSDFAVLLGECQDPQPALDRILFALEGGPGARKKHPVHVNVGIIAIHDAAVRPDFTEVLDRADRILRSLETKEGSQVAHDSLPPVDSARAGAR